MEELDRFVAAAEFGERHHDPERRVRVLPAVLPQTRRIALDVARILLGPIEGRREQSDELWSARDELGPHCVHGALGERRRDRAR